MSEPRDTDPVRRLGDVEKPSPPPGIGCRGGCGAVVANEEAAAQAGWAYLEISRGYRCGACTRELNAASSLVGLNEGTFEELPPDSRGALPKETASTIMAPSVPRNVSNR